MVMWGWDVAGGRGGAWRGEAARGVSLLAGCRDGGDRGGPISARREGGASLVAGAVRWEVGWWVVDGRTMLLPCALQY